MMALRPFSREPLIHDQMCRCPDCTGELVNPWPVAIVVTVCGIGMLAALWFGIPAALRAIGAVVTVVARALG